MIIPLIREEFRLKCKDMDEEKNVDNGLEKSRSLTVREGNRWEYGNRKSQNGGNIFPSGKWVMDFIQREWRQ